MLDNLQNWSASLKLIQGGFLITLFVYIAMFVDGGFFSAYYAWILAVAGGVIAAIASMVQKNSVMVMVDLGLVALTFIHFIQLA